MSSSKRDGSTDRTVAPEATTEGAFAGGDVAIHRLAAFWTAVVLPFVAVGVLVTGMDSAGEWWLFGGLVTASAVSMYVGHPYAEP